MDVDAYGFNYPHIDSALCISCEKCIQICRDQKEGTRNMPLAAYAARGTSKEMVENSSSGGVFAALAASCLHEKGFVAGAVMDCDNSHVDVYHILSESVRDLRRMQGSKYVQSEAWRSYEDIMDAVKTGKPVLFSGTPCQVDAVKRLTGDPDNLVTIDLICHGVPSQQMLNDYLNILEKYLLGSICGFTFRDKSIKKLFSARIDLRGKRRSVFVRSHDMSFYKLFLNGTIFRESCYCCPYASLERTSDITIGDYWGIEEYHNILLEQSDSLKLKDWSCVLVNTEKGKAFLDRYGNSLSLVATEVSWIQKKNQQLVKPSQKHKHRDEILSHYSTSGYWAIESRFIRENGGFLRFFLRMIKKLHWRSKY